MAEKPSGLGNWGAERFKQNIGSQQEVGGQRATTGSRSTFYEEALFTDRPDGPLTPAAEPPTPWFYPESSRVYAYQYDPFLMQLRVKFIKYGTPWVYNDVPSAVFQAFDASPSKGMYINSTLNYFPYRRANAAEVTNHFFSVSE
jgi:hypothetical protein